MNIVSFVDIFISACMYYNLELKIFGTVTLNK